MPISNNGGSSPLSLAIAQQQLDSLMKSSSRPSREFSLHVDPLKPERKQKGPDNLVKSILNKLNGEEGSIERLAFETDPSTNVYNGLYKQKLRLLPDAVLKRILIQDDLVAAIVQARQNQISAFGRPRPDRFSTGFVIEAHKATLEAIEGEPDEQKKQAMKKQLRERIATVTKRMLTCGSTKGWGDEDLLTFPRYLSMSVRNAVGVGRLATEVIRVVGEDGKKHFHSFRVIDAGTIYRTAQQKRKDKAAQQVRRAAKALLEQARGEKLDPERYMNDEYAWVQVIDDKPVQAFTAQECLVHQFYSVPDVELDGYPVTPLDMAITAVTTHLNITTHNKMYFQTGRATRGMLVIKSENINDQVIARIRQQFTAQINSVQNAWRMPCFGIGPDDDVNWMPIDSGGRDMEFQYLSDMNARVILSAFQMSPEELPGFAYLSRGTNNQALSEGNNEYRLEAHRDLGIRPLLAQLEDFLNHAILPLFDEELAKLCSLKLVGLDAETAEKEAVRLGQDQPIHLNMDEILEKVEKTPVGKRWGGEMLFNPMYLQNLDKYVKVGDILEHFFGVEGASKDPQWDYARDPFFWQQRQWLMQQQQMAMQQQQMQQQAAMGAPPGGQDPNGGGAGGAPAGGGDDSGGGGAPSGGGQDQSGDQQQPQQQQQQDMQQQMAGAPAQELTGAVGQALDGLSKGESEAVLPPAKRRLIAQQKLVVEHAMKEWDTDLLTVEKDIIALAKRFKPKTKA